MRTLHVRIFGSIVFALFHVLKNQRTKPDVCALKCVFVRYDTQQKVYKLSNQKDIFLF